MGSRPVVPIRVQVQCRPIDKNNLKCNVGNALLGARGNAHASPIGGVVRAIENPQLGVKRVMSEVEREVQGKRPGAGHLRGKANKAIRNVDKALHGSVSTVPSVGGVVRAVNNPKKVAKGVIRGGGLHQQGRVSNEIRSSLSFMQNMKKLWNKEKRKWERIFRGV